MEPGREIPLGFFFVLLLLSMVDQVAKNECQKREKSIIKVIVEAAKALDPRVLLILFFTPLADVFT